MLHIALTANPILILRSRASWRGVSKDGRKRFA